MRAGAGAGPVLHSEIQRGHGKFHRGMGMEILEKLKPFALLLLRCALGAIFMYHGYPKLFTQAQRYAGAFPHMGFPPYFAYIAGVLEFFGGILLIAGLFTRVTAALLGGEMAIAIWMVHLPQGGWRAVANFELPMILGASAFALVAMGAGIVSLDYALSHRGGRRGRRR
jgi:putative oxidoreductase